MPAKNGFQLVTGDIALLQCVHELRLATIEHLATVLRRSYKQTQKRLSKLEERRYLSCVARRPHKHLYALGREGTAVLIESGYAPHDFALKRPRHNELKDLGIRHTTFIVDIHVKLLGLTRDRGLDLPRWAEGSTLWDRVTTSNSVVIPIRPDAWFVIDSLDGGRYHFLLEADRGTMAHSRMREKIAGYAAFFQQKRHIQKYDGMKTFRVLTITETRGRAQALASEFSTMMPAGWLAAYPVIAFEDLTLAALVPELAGGASDKGSEA